MKTEYGKKVYYYQAIIWNSLPIVIQESKSFKEFDHNMSNLLIRCRTDMNVYSNEDRILNRYTIRNIYDEDVTLLL